MYYLLVLLPAFQALASPGLRAGFVGNFCGGSASMQPTSLFSWDWPPVGGEAGYFGLTVNILQSSVQVQEIYITEQLDTSYWNHIEVDVNQAFNSGTGIAINFVYQYPTAPGTYVVTFQPSNGQHLGCWQIGFITQ